MSFVQDPPQLGNQYLTDQVLQSYLHRHLPPDLLQLALADLEAMGTTAATLSVQQLTERSTEPKLTHWDAWGQRIDRIELTPLWRQAREIAATSGLVATAYEGNFQPHGRLVQFALVYLFHPSSDMFSCPLAMTDGAARALLEAGDQDLIHRAVGRLTSRDPQRFWTSGQWMTEITGGSDVSRTETEAWRDSGQWRLRGKKWFTSAATSEMALVLARPVAGPRKPTAATSPSSHDLALFYVEPFTADGQLNNIEVLRLKDKLGTRKLPTAELLLSDTPATLVGGDHGGIKAIAPMLNVTRCWNAVCAVSFMRRALALAEDYAARRHAAGRALKELPLHQHTLALLRADFEACFQLTFWVVRQLGLAEHQQLGVRRQQLLRLLIPITKLLTGKKVVETCSEALECFGGAGYVEDTGLPLLLRDAQVLPIWEGTTNVLALDVLRVLRDEEVLEAWSGFVRKQLKRVTSAPLEPVRDAVKSSAKQIRRWQRDSAVRDDDLSEAGARCLALTLGLTTAAALLAEHAQYQLDIGGQAGAVRSAQLFAARGLSLLPLAQALATSQAPPSAAARRRAR